MSLFTKFVLARGFAMPAKNSTPNAATAVGSPPNEEKRAMLAAVTTHRPKLVWVIACWYGLWTIFGILGTAARYSEIQPMGDPRTFVKTVYTVIPPDYLSTGVHLLDFIVMGAAAFLLFRLHKSAVEVCGITLALKVFVWLFPAIRGDFTRMGFHYIHTALIIGGVFFLMPPFVIFLYARKLREKGILT